MTKETRIYNGEKTASSINSVEITGQRCAKESNWTTSSDNAQKNKFKMYENLKCNMQNHSLLEENIGIMPFDIGFFIIYYFSISVISALIFIIIYLLKYFGYFSNLLRRND